MMRDYLLVTRADDLGAIANRIHSAGVIGLDIETYEPTGGGALDPRHGEIRLVQLNIDDVSIYVIDAMQTKTLDPIVAALASTKAVLVVHNCLTGCSRVSLADGSTMLLRDMVRQRHPGPVLSYNEKTGRLESKRVTNWLHAAPRNWEDWFRLRFVGKGEVRLTRDHKVITARGRVAAEDLEIGDRVATSLSAFSVEQEAVIYGSLLGDSSIRLQRGAKARAPLISFSHEKAQSKWLAWKESKIPLAFTRTNFPPTSKGFSNNTEMIRSTSNSDPRLVDVLGVVTEDGKKTLSSAWLAKLGPAAVAVWLMDDGSLAGHKLHVCVSAFRSTYPLLLNWLRENGWPAEEFTRLDGQIYFRIGGVSGDGEKFWEAVAPFFVSSMAHKVPAKYQKLVGTGWSLEEATTVWFDTLTAKYPLARDSAVPIVDRHGGWLRKGVGPSQYCLEVEDNGNFVANGKVVANCKFEQKWFWHKYKLPLWPIFCTYRASALIYNGKKMGHDLWSVQERELQIKNEAPDQGGSDWSVPALSKTQYDYAAEDVSHLLVLRKHLKALLSRHGLIYTALIEFNVILPEGVVELNGIPINQARWRALEASNAETTEQLANYLRGVLPHPTGQLALPGFDCEWNLDSQQQMLVSLNKMGLKLPDTKKLTMGMLAGEYPIVNKVIEYRKFAKRGTSFGIDWLRWVDDDERIHGDYFSLLVSGRYSMSKPNIQQIPREFSYRNCFAAPPGKKLVLADYAGIEMRIVAEVSGDVRLTKVFTSGQDAHYATASLIMGKSKESITKLERQMAKPVNFGFIYGMFPEKLVLYALGNYGVPMTVKQATQFRERYFDKTAGYAGVARWHEREMRDVKRSRISRNMGGRLRHMDEDAHNDILNNPIQSVGADGLKISMRKMHERLAKYGSSAMMIHHVHDEIILEVDDDPEIVASAKQDLIEAMTEGMSPFLKRVPIEVEASVGPSWGAAKN